MSETEKTRVPAAFSTLGWAVLAWLIAISAAPTATLAATPTLTPLEKLGQALFVDTTLSNPHGQSCASCHSQNAGWTSPNSKINEADGPAPGAISTRFGARRVATIGYAALLPEGPPAFVESQNAFAGGFFYDGRAATLADQIPSPMLNPNEMNNTPGGVVKALINGPNAALFEEAFKVKASSLSVTEAFDDVVAALVAFEQTPIFFPFDSRYDAYVAGKAKLTAAEMAGLQLFTGSKTGRPGGARVKSATCSTCHTVQEQAGAMPDLFTSSTFHNTGIPKNPNNPYYKQTSKSADPTGYNPLGANFIDYGLGDTLYPLLKLPDGNIGQGSNGRGDYLMINGVFKTPTLRNIDLRPTPDFVKCYGHNGFFKSLAQIVHFYNTRNLTSEPGEVINFTMVNPYAHLRGKPLWPPPEISEPTTLVNPIGAQGLIGNLGLTSADEANLVAFLHTLSDSPSGTP